MRFFYGFVFVEICPIIRSKAYFIFRNDRFYFIENEYFESNFVITNNVTTTLKIFDNETLCPMLLTSGILINRITDTR